MKDKDSKLLSEAYDTVEMNQWIDEWEDALALVNVYLNKEYANNVPKLVAAMERAITAHYKIEALKPSQ